MAIVTPAVTLGWNVSVAHSCHEKMPLMLNATTLQQTKIGKEYTLSTVCVVLCACPCLVCCSYVYISSQHALLFAHIVSHAFETVHCTFWLQSQCNAMTNQLCKYYAVWTQRPYEPQITHPMWPLMALNSFVTTPNQIDHRWSTLLDRRFWHVKFVSCAPSTF